MISERLKRLTINNSAIRAMFEEGNRLAREFGRENVYDFSLGNPNLPAPPELNRALIDVIENEDSVLVHGYMSNPGYIDVRAAVAENLNKRFGTAFDESNIMMTVGAAGGINVAFCSILNPGDEVLVLAPYFVDYDNYIENHGGRPVIVQTDSETFLPDPVKLEAAITPKTKALIINNPNNPTGVIYPAASIAAIAEVLERKSAEYGEAIYLVSDEPYRELAYDGAEVPWLTSFYKNTIVGYSWSKSLSLPGERIGYLVLPSELDEYQAIWDACCVAIRMLGFINAPSLLQRAVVKCLDAKSDLSFYDTNRRLLYDGLTALGFECVFPSGAFYLWMKSPIADEKEFSNIAKKYNLLVVPGAAFKASGYVRLAYCVSKEMIERSLVAFEKLAAELKLK